MQKVVRDLEGRGEDGRRGIRAAEGSLAKPLVYPLLLSEMQDGGQIVAAAVIANLRLKS